MKLRLTEKQDAFAHGVSEGLSQSDAYRQAYCAEGMKPNVIHVEASRLAANPRVTLRIDQLFRQKGEDHRMQAIRRREFVLDELQHEAATATSASARVRALELLGKTVGLFVKQDADLQPRTLEMLESELNKLLFRNR